MCESFYPPCLANGESKEETLGKLPLKNSQNNNLTKLSYEDHTQVKHGNICTPFRLAVYIYISTYTCNVSTIYALLPGLQPNTETTQAALV